MTRLQKLLAFRGRFVRDMARGHVDPRKVSSTSGFMFESTQSLASGLAELEADIATERFRDRKNL